MPIKVVLGLGLDGATLSPHENDAGVIIGGPSRILEWFESQVGLGIPIANFTERSLTYLSCLKQVQEESTFYSASLEADPIAVSNQLLRWRDQWYLSGWDGGEISVNSERLCCLANEVEPLAKDLVALNEGQRLQRVIAIDVLPIDLNVSVIDPPEAWPLSWRLLLEKIGAVYEGIIQSCVAEPNSDLGRLQQNLLFNKNEKVDLNGDGSIAIIKASSRSISSNWFADQIVHQLDSPPAILVDGDGSYIDSALQTRGLPQLNVGEASVLRPIYQVLPLAMSLIWKPLNPFSLLEFLAHPVGPLPKKVRRVLAEVVAEFPGIGSDKWLDTVQRLIGNQQQYCIDNGMTDTSEQLEESINFWLASERFDPSEGAPVDFISTRVDRLQTWMSAKQNNQLAEGGSAEELTLYTTAIGHLKAIKQTLIQLSGMGERLINADELLRIISEVQVQGTTRPDTKPELANKSGKILYAKHPSAINSVQEQLIWWGAENNKSFSSYGWSQAEQKQLHEAGIRVLPEEDLIKWNSDSWLKPLLASKKILFVIHKNIDAEHPILDLVRARTKNLPEYDLLDVIQGVYSGDTPFPISTEFENIGLLQEPKRFWQIPSTVDIPKREQESYSSLESFLYGPYMWVLRYPARIRSSVLLEPKDGNMLLGSISHLLFEEFFEAPEHKVISSIKNPEIEVWGRGRLLELITSSGAQLLMPGRAAQMEKFIHQTIRALKVLVEHLQTANVQEVALEHSVNGSFSGGSLGGYIDLIAKRPDGREAIIDMKWGGETYRKQTLRKNTCMQLAIYAQLRGQEIKRTADVGYFIIQSAELMMHASDFFSAAESIFPENGESITELWQRIDHTWKQRRKQLDEGKIEVPVSGTEPSEKITMDEKLLPLPDTHESFSEYTALVGWEDNA